MAVKQKPRHDSIKDFLDPKVITIAVTDTIIRKIYTAFPKGSKVISGYLSEEDLYWKVSWHWDKLLNAVEHCLTLAIDATHKNALTKIRKLLESNQPNPKTGYIQSKVVGLPMDKSSHEEILARHALVKQGKADFKAVVEAASIFSKITLKEHHSLMLAYAPVAKPALGKHSTGYALDIAGDNSEVIAIAKRLGATLTFNEGSHVHCEWKKGVDESGKTGQDSVQAARREVRQLIDSRVIFPRHCLLRTA